MGIVFYIATNCGHVRIELSDPKAKVTVTLDGDVIDITGLGKRLRVRTGAHDILVVGQDVDTEKRSFIVKRGEDEVVRIALVPKATVDAVEMVPLDAQPTASAETAPPTPDQSSGHDLTEDGSEIRDVPKLHPRASLKPPQIERQQLSEPPGDVASWISENHLSDQLNFIKNHYDQNPVVTFFVIDSLKGKDDAPQTLIDWIDNQKENLSPHVEGIIAKDLARAEENRDLRIKLQIGSTDVVVNGRKMRIDTAPHIVEGRTIIDASLYHQARALALGSAILESASIN